MKSSKLNLVQYDLASSEVVAQMNWQLYLSSNTLAIHFLKLTQLLQIMLVQMIDDTKSNHKQKNRSYCISLLSLNYLVISARTAGECFTPTLEPQSSSREYPSQMRACSASRRKFSSSPERSRGAFGSFCTIFWVENADRSALLIIKLRLIINNAIAINIYNYSMSLDYSRHAAPSWHKVYQQTIAILAKNLYNTTANKTKFIAEFIFPLMISAIYALAQHICPGSALKNSIPICENAVMSLVMNMLLLVYVGLIGTSALRQLVTLFISQRNDQFRQYQMIMGVSYKTHTLANLLYMQIYLSVTILPFYITLNYYHFNMSYALYFAAFVISSSYLTLALAAFFKDQKIALQIIGLFYSLTSFLPFFYDRNTTTYLNYIISIIPNSSFTMALIQKDFTISLMSLSFCKIYILIFLFMQFREIILEKIRKCCKLIKQYAPSISPQNTVLMQEIELNDIINPQLKPSQPNRKVIITTHALSKQYSLSNHSFFALNNLSIQIYQSQIFGLLGRNGSGKTTLVDILTKVTKPSNGTVDIATINGIGICYQHQILYENLTVIQHLHIYSKLKVLQEGQHAINDIIKMLKIEEEVTKKVKDLSGGNKRKLSIAIAILNKPQILIFDEPTSGLDPLSRTYIWDILMELKRRNSTIILTTHHLDEAERLSDTICVIQKGICIVQNTPQFIKQKYGKGFHFKISQKIIKQNESLSFDYYRRFLEDIKLKYFQIESSHSSVNILIRSDYGNKHNFQSAFQKWIEKLEKDVDIQFKFHSNTLEESFLAILQEQDNTMRQSLPDAIQLNRSHLHSIASQGLMKWLCQVWGVILKNYYYRKSTLYQSLILYNINILIVIIYTAFNSLLQQNILKDHTGKTNNQQKELSNPMMLIQGYIAMATAFITSPVYQTEKKISSVLSARGLRRSCYWIGNFIFDYIVFMLNLCMMKYLIASNSIDEVGFGQISCMGASMIIYAYCISKMFSKTKTASAWFSVINMFFGFIIMPMIIMGSSNSFFKRMSIIKYAYPFYSLTLNSITKNPALNVMPNIVSAGDSNQPTTIISLILYISILILIEIHPLQRILFCCYSNTLQLSIQNTIQLQSVSKKFGKIMALQNVNYSINQQRVALLGHNGAGKSTTFSLLTLQDKPAQGALYVQKRLTNFYERVLTSTGVCYQQDALWEQMIVGQIISIVKWIVPIEDGEEEASWLFKSLQFDGTNVFKRFSSLSGGNKRKLCLLMAIFGNPELRLLDQCSTGLDPSSRAAMVSTIKYSKKGSTLFTTHSMSQAQKVCSKAIIMSKGRVLQFDDIEKLIGKHFQCWWIDIMLSAQQNIQLLQSIVPNQFENMCSVTIVGRNIRLQINKLVKKSQVFKWICDAKKKGIIVSYSWVEPLLEDVYIKLTCEHIENAIW